MESKSHYVVKLAKDYCDYADDLMIHIGLFKDVNNTCDLCDKAIQEKAVFVDACLVLSLEQLLIAVNRSLYLRTTGKNRLNNFYAEILFNLSISKNITESLKQFGIEKLKDKKSTNLIVITIDNSPVPELFSRVNGVLCQPSNESLAETCDRVLMKKVYKTDDLSLIHSKIASKEFLN